MKKLAIWDYPASDLLVYGLLNGQVKAPFTLQKGSPLACTHALDAGEVEVALVPTLHILRNPEPYEVVPEVGWVSRQQYPFARLLVRSSLDAIEQVAFDPRFAQEVLLTQIILREHYDQHPGFVPVQPAHPDLLAQYDAVLLVGPEVPFVETSFLTLDLGQEWLELTGYPMVWGLLAAREPHLTVEEAALLREAARVGDASIPAYVEAMEPREPLRSFLLESFSPLLVGPAEGGLDEFAQYLFFYGVLDEIPDVPFIHIPEEEEEEDE